MARTEISAERLAGSSADPAYDQLLEEVVGRMRAGAFVDIEICIAQHPEFAERLRNVLPAMQLLAAYGEKQSNPGGFSSQVLIERVCGNLGDFQLIREIGRGGMGVVYEAEQISLKRRVALKVLPFAAIGHQKALQRFHNEVRAAATLDHPHIVSVYSVGEERGIHYYAMQLIRGYSVAEFLTALRGTRSDARAGALVQAVPHETAAEADGPSDNAAAHDTAPLGFATTNLDEPRRFSQHLRLAAQLALQAADALQHAHDQGVLHRDVKPGNLLVDTEGKLFVTDFGLARIQSDAGMTMTGDVVGTLRYMAPEQALAKRVVTDHRADVYSLGATLYELLTLQPAFSENDRTELLKQIAYCDPKPLRKLNRRIPHELETIVRKAMEKNPDDRYQSAQQLADDLRAFAEHRPIKAKPPTLLQRATKYSRRNRPLFWTAAVALLLCAVAIGGSAGWLIRDREYRRAIDEAKVAVALNELEAAYEKGLLMQAESALATAVRLAAAVNAGTPLEIRLRQWEKDLGMVRRLEALSAESGGVDVGDGQFRRDDIRAEYAEAFADYGLLDKRGDEVNFDTDLLASKVRTSKIRSYLAPAMTDFWTFVSQSPEEIQFRQLLDKIDPDPWRKEFRDAIKAQDHEALIALAQAQAVIQQPRGMICTLAAYLQSHGESHLALKLLTRVQHLYPADFSINLLLGFLQQDSDPSEAAGCLRIALIQRPEYTPARVTLSKALENAGKLAAAAMETDEVVRRVPHDHEARHRQAYLYWKQYEFAKAETAIRECIAQDASYPNSYLLLGRCLDCQLKWKEAATAYRKCLKISPENINALLALACVLKMNRQSDEAQSLLNEAAELSGHDADSYQTVAKFVTMHGHFSQSELMYRKLIEMRPDGAIYRYNLGYVLRRSGKQLEANAAFQDAAEVNPYLFVNHLDVGNFYGSEADVEYAFEEYMTASEKEVESFTATARAAILALSLERPDYPSQKLKDRLSLASVDKSAVEACAALLCSIANKDEAEAALRITDLLLDVNSTEYKSPMYLHSAMLRGLAAYRVGDNDGALKWCATCRMYHTCPPELYAQALLVEAMACHRLGRLAEADAAYNKATMIIRVNLVYAPERYEGDSWFQGIFWDLLHQETAALLKVEESSHQLEVSQEPGTNRQA